MLPEVRSGLRGRNRSIAITRQLKDTCGDGIVLYIDCINVSNRI